MSTVNQQILAKEIVENSLRDEPLTAGQMLEKVGYATSVAEGKPGEIIQSKGVQDELNKLGFSTENAKRVVGEILGKEFAEDKDRLKAAELIFKVQGDMAPEKHINLNIQKKIVSVDE
jgi:hypothetical protein